MHPEDIPNLLATVSHPPWTQNLNLDLHTTGRCEEHIPFHFYVRLSTARASSQSDFSLFPNFGILSAELQVHILSFCSPATLFQIMRVSSRLRTEASQLFWGNLDAYFFIESSWILDKRVLGFTCWDRYFLYHVQNIEIELDYNTHIGICPKSTRKRTINEDRIAAFWGRFEQRFPSAKRVIITCHESFPLGTSSQTYLEQLRVLIEACPVGLKIHIRVLEEQQFPTSVGKNILPARRWQGWNYHPVPGYAWAKSEEKSRLNTVLMPIKHFMGLVGEFQRVEYELHLESLKASALGPLMIEFVARSHLRGDGNDSFLCPALSCSALLTSVEEWTVHAGVVHSMAWCDFHLLPDKMRAMFKKRQIAEHENGWKTRMQLKKLLSEWWDGEEKRVAIKREFMSQIDDDKSSGEDDRMELGLWRQFVCRMERYHGF